MAQHFNGIIATQTDHFAGVSTVDVRGKVPNMQGFRSLSNSVYGVEVTGGVSGTFGVFVIGSVGGATYVIAGSSARTAAGSTILYPATYDADGVLNAPETNKAVTTQEINYFVPPTHVVFSGASAANNFGVSAAITVSAVLNSAT